MSGRPTAPAAEPAQDGLVSLADAAAADAGCSGLSLPLCRPKRQCVRQKGAAAKAREPPSRSKDTESDSFDGMALSDSEDSQEVAQPSRKRKKQSSARLQRHEMQEFIDEHKASKRSKTNSQYASHDKKFKWFLEHHYGGETEEEPGTVRKEPYSEDLTLEYGLDLAVRYISWVGKNMPGFEYRNKAATLKLKTFEGVHSALQSMYTQQLMSKHARSTQHVTRKLHDYPAYHTVYTSVTARMALKGQRPGPDVDPQDGCAQDTLQPQQLGSFVDLLMSNGSAAASRDLSMSLWLTMVVGRSDDGRLVHLADLCPPTPVACIGPAPCVLLSAVLRGGKTQENGKVAYLGCIRTRNPLLCPVGALGRHLCQRFTIDKEPFPDVLDKEAWNKTALWTGSNPFSNLTYQQQSASLRKYFTESDIFIKKLTHAFRVLGARFMDMAGVDDSVIGRTGKWMYQAMYKSYLMFFKPEGLLGVGEWPGAAQKDFTQFWRPEFLLEVPDDLIYVVFPHLRRLEEVVKELGRKAGNSVKAAPHVYRYLATVVIQDALGGMADKYPDHPVHALLRDDLVYQQLANQFAEAKLSGAFDQLRPRTAAERNAEMQSMLADMAASLDSLGAASDLIMTALTSGQPMATLAASLPSDAIRSRYQRVAFRVNMQRQLHAPKPVEQEQAACEQAFRALEAQVECAGEVVNNDLAVPEADEDAAPAMEAPTLWRASQHAEGSCGFQQQQQRHPASTANASVQQVHASSTHGQPLQSTSSAPLQLPMTQLTAYHPPVDSCLSTMLTGGNALRLPAAVGINGLPAPQLPFVNPAVVFDPALGYVRLASSLMHGAPLLQSLPAHQPVNGTTLSAGQPAAAMPSLPSKASSGGHMAGKPRPFASLSSYSSVEQLYTIIEKGDPKSGTPALAELEGQGTEWRRAHGKRWYELKELAKEIQERAAAESTLVSPSKVARDMDADRVRRGKKKGKPMPVATYVKTVVLVERVANRRAKLPASPPAAASS